MYYTFLKAIHVFIEGVLRRINRYTLVFILLVLLVEHDLFRHDLLILFELCCGVIRHLHALHAGCHLAFDVYFLVVDLNLLSSLKLTIRDAAIIIIWTNYAWITQYARTHQLHL